MSRNHLPELRAHRGARSDFVAELRRGDGQPHLHRCLALGSIVNTNFQNVPIRNPTDRSTLAVDNLATSWTEVLLLEPLRHTLFVKVMNARRGLNNVSVLKITLTYDADLQQGSATKGI